MFASTAVQFYLAVLLIGICQADDSGSFLRCYRLVRRAYGDLFGRRSCFVYVNERTIKLPSGEAKIPLSNVYQEINSEDLFGSEGYPRNIRCIWKFKLKKSHNAYVGCSYLNLDEYDGDCRLGRCCSRALQDTGRDYLQIYLNPKCERGDSPPCNLSENEYCSECCAASDDSCSHLHSSRESINFCGKPRKAGAKVRACELRNGKLEIEFRSDESRRGRGFKCFFVDTSHSSRSRHSHIFSELFMDEDGLLNCNETNDKSDCELLRKLKINSLPVPSIADAVSDLLEEPTTESLPTTTKEPPAPTIPLPLSTPPSAAETETTTPAAHFLDPGRGDEGKDGAEEEPVVRAHEKTD